MHYYLADPHVSSPNCDFLGTDAHDISGHGRIATDVIQRYADWYPGGKALWIIGISARLRLRA